MNISRTKKTCTGMITTGCVTLFAAMVMVLSPAQIDEAKALSIAYPGGHHFNHHKFRHRNHHRRYHRGHRSRFHFGFHGSRYYGPRYYGRHYYGPSYYGGGYPVAQPVPVPVPVAPPVICPIGTVPIGNAVSGAAFGGAYGVHGAATGPIYHVFRPGGC